MSPFLDVEKTALLEGVSGKKRPRSIRRLVELLFSLGTLGLWAHQSIWLRTYTPVSSQGPINWTPCGDNIECGHLSVPLDYHNVSLGTANLAVARYLATNKTAPRLGSLFTNPGGPGGSGVNYVYRAGPRISGLVDGRYDIVSWDPRGVNQTTPRVECFDSQTAHDIYFAHTHQETHLEGRNLTDPIELAVYTASARRADARNAALARLCSGKSGEVLNHVGTATVVRDLELLSRIIEGERKPINFWGFSYGTIIGSYFVNMFPDRVGRVILDGVVDPVRWATTHSSTWYKYHYVDTDHAFENFLKACHQAAPGLCPLASGDSSSRTIGAQIDKFLDDLYEYPLPVEVADRPGALTSGMIRGYIFKNMYSPRNWPKLAENLHAAMHGNGTAIMNSIQDNIELDKFMKPRTAQAIDAVLCVDTPPYPPNVDKVAALQKNIDEAVLAYELTSKNFASLELDMCHHWTPRETERFTGPFNSSLSNTILIIGNTADPITPAMNAKTVNQLLQNHSRLIIQDGSGHCSSAMASLCTGNAIRRYFLRGKLPPNGIVCPTNEDLFPSGRGNSTETSTVTWMNTTDTVSDEDRRLLENLRDLGLAMEPWLVQGRR